MSDLCIKKLCKKSKDGIKRRAVYEIKSISFLNVNVEMRFLKHVALSCFKSRSLWLVTRLLCAI